MKKLYFQFLEEFSLIIYREGTKTGTKSFRLKGKRILLYSLLYTFIVALLGFYLIYLTPLQSWLLPSGLKKTTLEEQQYEELSFKIVQLTNELENLKSANKRLKNAILLGDSTLYNDSIQKSTEPGIKNKLPVQGSIILSLNALINKLFFRQQEENLFFIQPIKGYISRDYKPDQGHKGIDYVAKENTPVYAAAAGYVIFANYTPQFGYTMLINHSSGYLTKYMHCSQLLKKEGDIVIQGELIALSGNTGTETTGPHLHFEIWKNGIPVDPKKVLLNY